MTSTLASMDLREQLMALSLGNAPHEDTIGATAVEIPFYHRVIRKDIVFQVVPDLGDPCIGTSLSRWEWRYEVSRILNSGSRLLRTPLSGVRTFRQRSGCRTPMSVARLTILGRGDPGVPLVSLLRSLGYQHHADCLCRRSKIQKQRLTWLWGQQYWH